MKLGTPLSENNHRAGSPGGINANASGEVDVQLFDSSDDDILLDVYRAATSLEKAESKSFWRSVRERTARCFAGFGKSVTIASEDSIPSSVRKQTAGSVYADLSQLRPPNDVAITEWILPSKSLVVRIGHTVLQSIQRAVLEAGSRHPALPLAGCLLGNVTRSAVYEITVQHNAPLCDWDACRGGLPFATERQTGATRRPRSWPAELTPVGLYRTARLPETDSSANSDDKRRRDLMQADASVIRNCATVGPATGIVVRLDPITLEPQVSVLWSDGGFYDLLPAASQSRSPIPKIEPSLTVDPLSAQADNSSYRNDSYQPAEREASARRPRSWIKPLQLTAWLLATVCCSFLAYVGMHVYVRPLLSQAMRTEQRSRDLSITHPAIEPVLQEDTMSLRVEPRHDGSLEIAWNPRSTPAKDAANGNLSITDNGHLLRSIELSADELHSGRLIYMPVSPDVTIHLTITDKAGHETSEWIRLRSQAGAYKRVREGYELGVGAASGSSLRNE